jgi:hypothetical protein
MTISQLERGGNGEMPEVVNQWFLFGRQEFARKRLKWVGKSRPGKVSRPICRHVARRDVDKADIPARFAA